jgi:hypothetical protein
VNEAIDGRDLKRTEQQIAVLASALQRAATMLSSIGKNCGIDCNESGDDDSSLLKISLPRRPPLSFLFQL